MLSRIITSRSVSRDIRVFESKGVAEVAELEAHFLRTARRLAGFLVPTSRAPRAVDKLLLLLRFLFLFPNRSLRERAAVALNFLEWKR